MKMFATVFVTLAVLLVLLALLAWSGIYNVAAVEPETPMTQWLLSAVRDRSIAQHSTNILPPLLSDSARVQAGARLYDVMCVICHSAPGRERSEISQGLNPPPPELHRKTGHRYSDAEVYWIVKNGIGMTGMPAFGPAHAARELWDIVAFLKHLPTLTPEGYDAMVQATKAPHSHSH